MSDPTKKLDLQACRDALKPELADPWQDTNSPITGSTPAGGDFERRRVWREIPESILADCLLFLETYSDPGNEKPCFFVDNPMIGGTPTEGRWRSATVGSQVEGQVGSIIQILRRGFMQELNWDEARLFDHRRLPSTATIVGVIAATEGDAPQKHIMVQWVGVDPTKAAAIEASIPQDWGTTRTINGNPIAGPMSLRITSSKPSDDGSHIITAYYSCPQYTLSGFSNYGGSNQQAVHKLYQVPQTIAQGIIDAWSGTEGNSALPGAFDSTTGLVDLTLYGLDGESPTLEIEGIQSTCDTILNIYMAFRQTQAQITAFVELHATDHPTHPSSKHDMIGVSRDVRPSDRGDGYFDIIITERITEFVPDDHIITVLTHTGDQFEVREVRGYHVPKTAVDGSTASAVTDYLYNLARRDATAYDTNRARITKCQITRDDSCTFDFMYQIVTFVAGYTAVYPVMNDGIVRKYARRYWNQYFAPTQDPEGEDDQAAQPSTEVDEDVWPAEAEDVVERKVDIVQLEEHNGGLLNYTLVLTELIVESHIIDQQAETVLDENVVKTTVTSISEEAVTGFSWFMRRSRAITQVVTRVYSLNSIPDIDPVAEAKRVWTQIDGGEITNEREIAGYDEQRGVHYKDQIKTVLECWSSPEFYAVPINAGTVWEQHGGTAEWNAGTAGGGFP